MKNINYKKIVNSFYEWGMMRREIHKGWLYAGVDNPESLSDHTARASLIAYILAELEGENPEHCAMLVLIHDLGEIRIGDHHKVAARYLDTREGEKRAFEEQARNFPKNLEKKWVAMFNEIENRNTKAGIIAKDADWLEQAIAGLEYMDLGYKKAKNWVDNVMKALETNSAKKILKEAIKTNPMDWWQGLKKMTYKKIK